MKADCIQQIINKMETLPYRTILFDGPWGVGKSYALNEALEGNLNVCKVSMFGLNNAQQIYHEALFQLALKNNIGGKIGEIADNILEGVSKVWDKVGQAKNIVQSIANERELFLLLSKEFTSMHIIVIEDFERMKADLNLEEVFGVIEELKQCNYIKVILVANIEEMQCGQKEVFDKYNEKVIERSFHITEHAEHVAWSKMGIHAKFIEDFLSIHKVSNLRTLEKAQRFFEDVKLFCKDIENEQFYDELQLLCFAIVVESIERLFYKEPDLEETDSVKKMANELSNTLERRIQAYLYGIKCSNAFVEMLLRYYQEGELDKDKVDAEYKLFLKSGDKPNYYKTDDEIRRLLPELRRNMMEAENVIELNQFADAYISWSDILEENNEEILREYRNSLNGMLRELLKNGKEEIFNYSYHFFHLSSDKLKKICSEENEKMRELQIETYVGYLRNLTWDKKAYEYSYKLKQCFESSSYREIIKVKIKELYHRNSFPVDYVNEERYHTCYNIMYVLYHSEEEQFLRFCDELKLECDKMSKHRIENLVEEIVKK